MRVGRSLPGQEVGGKLGRVPAAQAGGGDDVPVAEIAHPDRVFRTDDVLVMFHSGQRRLPVPAADLGRGDGAFPAFRDFIARLEPDDPDLESLVRAHLGPAAGALLASRRLPRVHAPVAASDDRGIEPELALIVPVEPGGEGVSALVALLADEPRLVDGRAELVLVAAEPEARLLAGSLRRLAEFYQINVRLLPVTGPTVDYFDALELGARHVTAKLLLFLAQGVLPDSMGWVDRIAPGSPPLRFRVR